MRISRGKEHMFPPASDSTCAWIVCNEREVPTAIHRRWKSMWSAFPTPSTETSADGVNTEVHDVHKCGDSSPGGGELGTARCGAARAAGRARTALRPPRGRTRRPVA